MDLREITWEFAYWILWFRIRIPVAGPCEHGSETSRSVKGWKFLELAE